MLLPYDICITNKQKRKETLTLAENKASNIIEVSYQIAYWITFFLTWVIIPLLKSYESSGEFTRWEKFKYSIKSKLSQRGGDYSQNIQVNGNFSANNINNK